MTPDRLGMRTTAYAWCTWYDDGAPTGGMFWYQHGENDRDGMSPLQTAALAGRPDRWGWEFANGLRSWPQQWRAQQAVVCTIGRSHRQKRVVKPSHPLALAHLAAFWGLTSSPPEGLNGHWRVTYGIVAKRLGGLVIASSHAASNVIEVL
ncbi:MAG TPA: hypothetical protein VMS08_00150 [Candidatus Saccharimonadia bacterium]|nr:hypothetical protein [Candidatus Saccharimonadia bacterium]